MTRNVEVIVVRHLRLPVALWVRSRRWLESLLREFDIIVTEGDDDVPRELLDFVAAVSERFDQFTAAAGRRLEEAHTSDSGSVDVEMSLPSEAAAAARELWRLVSAADEYCRRGDLMTLSLDDELRGYLQWYLDEVIRQVEGAEPRPWSATQVK